MDHRSRTNIIMRMGTNEDPSQMMPPIPGMGAPMPNWGSSAPAQLPVYSGQSTQMQRLPAGGPLLASSNRQVSLGAGGWSGSTGGGSPYNQVSGSGGANVEVYAPYGTKGAAGGASMERYRMSSEMQNSNLSCISDAADDKGDSERHSQRMSGQSHGRKLGMGGPGSTSESTESGRSGASSHGIGMSSMSASTGDCRRFTAVQVYKATDGFNEANILGHGAFGSVFKGKLMGCQVAVKRLEGGGWQGPNEYRTEVEVLSRMRHPNIVLLMGHCPEEHCLVYEYLPGGSLQDFLNPARRRRNLTWADRVRVLAEISSALVYLHNHEPPIAHRDLKPDNVMLDGNMTSKLGDVGLARLVLDEDSNMTARVRGTAGYIDPEEVVTCEVSVLSDVYAFGLIALQMLLGEPAVKSVQKLLVECANAAGSSVGGRALSIAANVLMTKLDPSAGTWNPVLARQLAVLALRCADPKRVRRPDVAEEIQPLLQRATEEAQAELQRQQAGLEAQLICPLSQTVMTDPVVAADGFTYERSAIEMWLMMNDTSPSTGDTMPHKFLTPNNGLKQLLERK